jgi:hypothetical protein
LARDHLLVADAVLDGSDGAFGEGRRSRLDRGLGVHGLRRDDAEVAGGQLFRIAGRVDGADDVFGAREPKAAAVDGVDVLAREVVGPDLDIVQSSEVRREQRADRPAPDDADPHEYEASRAFTRR